MSANIEYIHGLPVKNEFKVGLKIRREKIIVFLTCVPNQRWLYQDEEQFSDISVENLILVMKHRRDINVCSGDVIWGEDHGSKTLCIFIRMA